MVRCLWSFEKLVHIMSCIKVFLIGHNVLQNWNTLTVFSVIFGYCVQDWTCEQEKPVVFRAENALKKTTGHFHEFSNIILLSHFVKNVLHKNVLISSVVQ